MDVFSVDHVVFAGFPLSGGFLFFRADLAEGCSPVFVGFAVHLVGMLSWDVPLGASSLLVHAWLMCGGFFVRAFSGVALSGAVGVGVPVWKGSCCGGFHQRGSLRSGVGVQLECWDLFLPLGAFSDCVACAYAARCWF